MGGWGGWEAVAGWVCVGGRVSGRLGICGPDVAESSSLEKL